MFPYSVFQLDNRLSSQKSKCYINLMSHHARNHNKEGTLWIIIRTEPILINKSLIEKECK